MKYTLCDSHNNFSGVLFNSKWAANMHALSIAKVAAQLGLACELYVMDNKTGEIWQAKKAANQYGEIVPCFEF